MSGVSRRGVAIGITALVLSGCTTMTGRSAGQYFDDKATQASVKTRLATVAPATLTRVNVDTYRGTIYLSGVVDSEARRRELEALAARSGPVVNNLQLRQGEVAPRAATATTSPGSREPSASPQSTMAPGAAQRYTGEVTRVDPVTGRVEVRAGERTYAVELPPAAVEEIRSGDRITVDMDAGGVAR